MPKVYKQKKSSRGAVRTCGRCGREIKPGEQYYQWSFRFGGTRYNCADHYPRASELTQSKMSGVYAAIEGAEDALPGASTVDEVNAIVQTTAEEIRAVSEEYNEAAEAMGAAGESSESRERADTLESAADQLEQWEAEEGDDENDNDDARTEIEKQEWAAMLRERGADPNDFRIDDPLSRAKAFEMFDMDVGVLERRVDARGENEIEESADDDAVEKAREEAHAVLQEVELP
jgi:hypothetical protein